MDFRLTICYDDADKITVSNLKETLENLQHDLSRRKQNEGCAVFELDKKKDIVEINKRINAISVIIDYFGGYTNE
jgi:GTP-binding protein EngB required for normal cell division